MRVYPDFDTAFNEIARELAETGIDTGDNASESELLNHLFMVIDSSEIQHQPTDVVGLDKACIIIESGIQREVYLAFTNDRSWGWTLIHRDGRVHIINHVKRIFFGKGAFLAEIIDAYNFLRAVCKRTNKIPGRYTQLTDCLVVYKKDLEGVF